MGEIPGEHRQESRSPVDPAGGHIAIDAVAGTVHDLDSDVAYGCDPMPPHLLAMLADGGLVPHLEKRFAEKEVP